MRLFMLKANPLKGAVSIKRSAVFVNENLPGGRPVVSPDAAEKESGGTEPPEHPDGLRFRAQQGIACIRKGGEHRSRAGSQALVRGDEIGQRG